MRKWLPLITVCLGTFMLLIDVTIVNVALPNMARDLRTSCGSLQWVGVAYAGEWADKPLRFLIEGNPFVSKR